MGKTRVIDLETSIKNRGAGAIGKMKASPHAPQNDIVYIGVYDIAEDNILIGDGGFHVIKGKHTGTKKAQLLVGHNIKFDLLYNMKHYGADYLNDKHIWDTMVVEYLLTGQRTVMPNLDALSKKYGGTLKDNRIKEMWDNDIDTEDIDPDILLPYFENDLKNTAIVYKGQIATAQKMGILPLIKSQMRALLATTEMEFNGMYFDKANSANQAAFMGGKVAGLEVAIQNLIKPYFPKSVTLNPNSNDLMSTFFFGGTVKEPKIEQQVDKDGKPA